MDVLDMYRMGMVSPEEFQALRRFYAAKKRAGSDVSEEPQPPSGAPAPAPMPQPQKPSAAPTSAAPPPKDAGQNKTPDAEPSDDRFDLLDRRMYEMGMLSREELERRLKESETDGDS
jgi:hypothetical protein